MNDEHPRIDSARVREIAAGEDDAARRSLAEDIAADWERYRAIIDQSMSEPEVRRWARSILVALLRDQASGELASRILAWEEDFSPSRRDRTTSRFVSELPYQQVLVHRYQLAGSNAASAFWERIGSQGECTVLKVARDVLNNADATARETTLHLLALDPYGQAPLGREGEDELLQMALDDPDPEIRGLAAEVVAADMPEAILDRWDAAPLDSSERVRMAFWQAALAHRADMAFEHAGRLVLDPERDHGSRRTALIALGEGTSTRQMSPLLQALLRGEDDVLAWDAAQLMWRHHRAPDIASAAAESRFEAVRDLAERLLHPERGSPAAGGSRPGDPTRTGEIFDRISDSEDWRGPDPEE